MSTNDDGKSLPKSMRHKQILDVARENPDAPTEELAAEVPSATLELVERVLSEHGDPADESTTASEQSESVASGHGATVQGGADGEGPTMTNAATSTGDADDQANASENGVDETAESESYPSLDDLSDKHRELIEAVAAQPSAKQKELANQFDVTPATVSRWASEITGFDWSERESFVATVVGDSLPIGTETSADSAPRDSSTNGAQVKSDKSEMQEATDEMTETVEEITTEVEQLSNRVQALEETDGMGAADSDSVFDDPEVVHKVAHACMESDSLTESEELRILEELLN